MTAKSRPVPEAGGAPLTPAQEGIVNRFLSELETWRAEHRGWTLREQLAVFGPTDLWLRAGGRLPSDGSSGAQTDGVVFERLMEIAGYRDTSRGGGA